MQKRSAIELFYLAVSLLTVLMITGLMLPATAATNQTEGFAGQVVSAFGALVAGAMVPTTAIDVTTQMTAGSS